MRISDGKYYESTINMHENINKSTLVKFSHANIMKNRIYALKYKDQDHAREKK